MEDTIVAICTLVGNSAINIIRISGKDSIKIVSKFFVGKDLNKVKGNTINYGKIKCKNEIIDEVLISVFKEEKSYTKENMVEINTHGGKATVTKILDILLEENTRMAEPGEFVKRAFLNGRIDLVEAESVSDLISSETENARKLSMKGITKDISNLINELRDEILEILGNIEVNIDYPEYEDAIDITNEILKEKIFVVKNELRELLNQSKKSNIVKNGLDIAIVGKPNVGKSSILNKLINQDKAIVTDIEGTTRDIVEGSIILNGTKINFIDTAGIRKTINKIESIGVKKTLEVIEKADLVLFVLNNNEAYSKEDEEIYKNIENKKKIIIINKNDLKNKMVKEFEEEVIYVNTKEKNSLFLLEETIKKLFNLGEIENGDFNYLSNVRQINLIKECLKIIEDIEKAIDLKCPVDLIEIDIKRIWDVLGEIIGKSYNDEMLNEIFGKFCLGK